MSHNPCEPPYLEAAVIELRLAVGQLARRLRAEVNAGDLTLSQSATLALLEKAGSATTADLARAESVKPQSIAAVLTRLEADGLICRRPHSTDGRQILFSLTDNGVEARRRRTIAKNDWLLTAMTQLDPTEQQTLVSAIALIKRLGEI